MKTGDIITSPTLFFKEGEVYVYTLPEEPSNTLAYYSTKGSKDSYDEAVSYARAHPFKVAEKDKNKILTMIYANEYHSGRTSEQIVDYWNNHKQDLTEYRIEGLRMKIEYFTRISSEVSWTPCTEEWYQIHRYSNREIKQVACLIEDDGVKN